MIQQPNTPEFMESNDLQLTRKSIHRHSITRATASSLAKAVRPNSMTVELPSRKKPALKSRRQSLVPDIKKTKTDQTELLTRQLKKSLIINPVQADTTEVKIHPLETPSNKSPEILADVLTTNTRCSPPLSRSSSEHTHNHHYDTIDEELPGYMRRPICAACNRNVKVTSSSETNHMHKSSSTATNSTRSSFSSASIQPGDTKKYFANPISAREQTTASTRPAVSISPKSSSSTHSNFSKQSGNSSTTSVDIRAHSPTSPIPTRKRTKPKKALFKQKKTMPVTLSMDKWNQLLAQQQDLISALTTKDSQDDIHQALFRLSISSQHQYETVLLETQAKILNKFTTIMIQQQQQQQQQRDALFAPSSSSMETILIETKQETTKPLDWQTKLEYSMTRLKWNLSHWVGNIIGTGEIEEQEFDVLGYPKSVVVSGVCVTTEPGLLPKDLQKFLKPEHGKVICHKYAIQLSKDHRLFKFQLIKHWVKDENVCKCEFSIRLDHKTKSCDTEFGLFQRRHHCRSCGHVFCQEHSSNRLPLFLDNGQRGEWSRVCDICFYKLVDPKFISRS
ncbi:uncharacterized protein B0P05DRAFT_589305 [Gilbertella persicaria]|uniref:uncharacterized protein n=1 Tax=Gilbertella persicaria TaxID=101096 RepID=UPI00221FE93F|nr:uncharacterized protein B0P05DRAFT_589305 [Gilbertella persicaria]KAI8069840.1 hypothetical protein B0P05DRAFT_589305 [Gilbertella persicaria]